MTVLLEPARAYDAPSIASILSDWIDDTPWMPRIHTPQQDQQFGRWLIDATDVTVARRDGDVVGFLARRDDEVHALYLQPGTRGNGVGGQLLDRAKAQRQQLDLWSFQANTGAGRFYARHGFVEQRRTDGRGNDEKLPDLRLTWTRI